MVHNRDTTVKKIMFVTATINNIRLKKTLYYKEEPNRGTIFFF